jgi:hypothetical protein
VRDGIGPVAALKTVITVKRLPKTRSGKILRGTIQKIADKPRDKTGLLPASPVAPWRRPTPDNARNLRRFFDAPALVRHNAEPVPRHCVVASLSTQEARRDAISGLALNRVASRRQVSVSEISACRS